MIKGVAYAGTLVSIRIAALSNHPNDCINGVCSVYKLSDTLPALAYVYSQRNTLSIASVNLSYGTPTYFTGHCDASYTDIAQQVNLLTGAGVAVVAASGNFGEDTNHVGTLSAPACIENVVSIAAVDKSSGVTAYSNISPTLDLFAPGGKGNTSGSCSGSHQCVLAALPGSTYGYTYGTSMAAPHVAGAIASLRNLWPKTEASAGTIVTHLKTTGLSVSYGGGSKPLLKLGQALLNPTAPASVNVERGLCYGSNWVSWPPSSGSLSHYQIQGSNGAGFSSPFILYSGPDTYATIDVIGTTWVRVRACNGPSCGSWTSGNRTATYTAGCV